jgi:hypothetical protein
MGKSMGLGLVMVARRSVVGAMSDPLFAPEYAEPVDVRDQVARMPGTVDAPCLCREPVCMWPFCCPTDEPDP